MLAALRVLHVDAFRRGGGLAVIEEHLLGLRGRMLPVAERPGHPRPATASPRAGHVIPS